MTDLCPFCPAEQTDLRMLVVDDGTKIVSTMEPDWIAHCWHFHIEAGIRECFCGTECKTLHGFRLHVNAKGGLHQHAADYLMGVKDGC